MGEAKNIYFTCLNFCKRNSWLTTVRISIRLRRPEKKKNGSCQTGSWKGGCRRGSHRSSYQNHSHLEKREKFGKGLQRSDQGCQGEDPQGQGTRANADQDLENHHVRPPVVKVPKLGTDSRCASTSASLTFTLPRRLSSRSPPSPSNPASRSKSLSPIHKRLSSGLVRQLIIVQFYVNFVKMTTSVF